MGIQFQSMFYFNCNLIDEDPNFEESKPSTEYKEKKKESKTTTQSLLVQDTTWDTEKDLNQTAQPTDKANQLIVKQPSFDDTGYEALELMKDKFLTKIKLIKSQLEREDHPLNQFISCFDQEFSDFFQSFLMNNDNEGKLL